MEGAESDCIAFLRCHAARSVPLPGGAELAWGESTSSFSAAAFSESLAVSGPAVGQWDRIAVFLVLTQNTAMRLRQRSRRMGLLYC